MRLTLAVLLAWLTIYCDGTVLSLPPSLIANAASLRLQQLLQPPTTVRSRAQQVLEEDEDPSATSAALNTLWKKDTRYLIDTNSGAERAADGFDSGARRIQSIQGNVNANNHNSNSNNNNNSNNYKVTSATAVKAAHQPRVGGGSGLDLNRKLAAEYDLNALLAAATTSSAAASAAADDDDEMDAVQSAELLFPPPPPSQPAQEIAPRMRDSSSEFFTPLKYWARQRCQLHNNCPQEYYRALLAGRNKEAALQQMQDFAAAASSSDDMQLQEEPSYLTDNADKIGPAAEDDGDVATRLEDDYVNNDIFMLLTGEQDLIKFLHWAMQQLYPYQKFANASGVGNGAEYYYPGMFIWKKLNLSGRLEPPMVVEEPHYVIVRREQLRDDLQAGGSNFDDDPFIPPRGRKHHLPDLDALLQRYETFVPNRGRRDKIKDIFKYDDLFFPNRGKKQRAPNKSTPTTLTTGETNLENEQELRDMKAATDDENAALADKMMAPPSSATTTTTTAAIRRMFGKLRRKLLQQRQQQKSYWLQHVAGNTNKQAYEFNNNNELPQRMSTHKINGYDRSVKSSMPAATSTATITRELSAPAASKNAMPQQQQLWQTRFISARPRRLGALAGATRVAANRLHSTRSMSAMPQQRQQQQQHRRPSTSLSSSPSSSASASASRYRRREQPQQQQQQEQHATIPQLPTSSSASASSSAAATTSAEQRQQHQVKSLTNLDPLLWRQLQLLQQKALTMRHAQLSPRQHLPQLQQQPLETQLDVANAAVAAAAGVADADDDIDYFYFNI